MIDYFILANYYYNMGFNVSHIEPLSDDFNERDVAYLKAPSHEWLHLIKRRQSLEELRAFDWINAIGIGVILGYNRVRAIDIDGSTDSSMLVKMLEVLGLGENYEWVVKSGSGNGYHIIFLSEEHNYETWSDKVKAFWPNESYANSYKHLELRYSGHLVLPPSVHYSYQTYKFLNGKYPLSEPLYVPLTRVESLVDQFCREPGVVPNKLKRIGEVSKFLAFDLPEDDYDGYLLVMDCETTGLPFEIYASSSDLDNWPRLVQLAYRLIDSRGKVYKEGNYLIRPDGFVIPNSSYRIHNIHHLEAIRNGRPIYNVLEEFGEVVALSSTVISHNMRFDLGVLESEFFRAGFESPLSGKRQICTMIASTEYCNLGVNGRLKTPKLSELYFKLFNEQYKETHNASVDVDITTKCFNKLMDIGVLSLSGWDYRIGYD